MWNRLQNFGLTGSCLNLIAVAVSAFCAAWQIDS